LTFQFKCGIIRYKDKKGGATMSEEIQIVAENAYGPNGVEVVEFLEGLRTNPGQAVFLAQVAPREYGRHYNNAMEDAKKILDQQGHPVRSYAEVSGYLIYLVNKR